MIFLTDINYTSNSNYNVLNYSLNGTQVGAFDLLTNVSKLALASSIVSIR